MKSLSFLFTDDPDFPTWWTLNPLARPVLTGWAAGHHAVALAHASHDQVVNTAVRSLARIMNLSFDQLQSQLTAAFFHDWDADPFFQGAYSYAAVGGIDAAKVLAAPVAGTLYFAGEATNSDGYNATVHGAIATGYRAAAEVLQAI
jgi:monoamine oxidase